MVYITDHYTSSEKKPVESIAEASLVHGIDANALVASLNEYFAGKESK